MDYSLADLTRITGAKRRAVQLWAEAGAIQAEADSDRMGTGNHRRFSRDEAIIACVVSFYAGMQVPIGQLIQVGRRFRELLKGSDRWPSIREPVERAISNETSVYIIVQDTAENFVVSAVERKSTYTAEENAGVDRRIGELVTERLHEPSSETIVMLLNIYVQGLR